MQSLYQKMGQKSVKSSVFSLLSRHYVIKSDIKFQSTLPRGERLEDGERVEVVSYISIHAPTGGATLAPYIARELFLISIHAPTGGATQSFS